MKTKLTALISLLLLPLSFAQYPDTCPAEAQGVLDAIGGCSAVDCNQFPAICEKCCTLAPAAAETENMNAIALVAVVVALGVIIWWRQKFKIVKKSHRKK